MAITGPTDACPLMVSATNPSGTQATYTIRQVLNATSYSWTVPAGVTVNAHPGGPGVKDTSIIVTYASNFTSGNITVTANASCGSSAVRLVAISRKIPAMPGAITGTTDACPLIGTANTATYSIAMPLSATSALWSVPAGAQLVSGQGTTSITVRFTNTFVSGNISVQGVNNCAISGVRWIVVTRNLPATPGIITSTLVSGCPSRVYTYSVPNAANATSYQWTVPANATITSGQGTTKITATYNGSASGTRDSVKVRSINNCAQSAWNKIKIGLAACPGAMAFGTEKINPKYAAAAASDQMWAEVSPNPTHFEFRLVVHSSNLKEAVHVRIVDASGRMMEPTRIIYPGQPLSIGFTYKQGVYFAEFIQGDKRKMLKLIRL